MVSVKKVISILILMILMFLAFEWGFTFFKKGHEVNYEVYFNDKKFQVDEVYEKTSTDIYDILITNDNHKYSYVIGNQYNKQKKIIKEILYYQENGIECIYPILENKTEAISLPPLLQKFNSDIHIYFVMPTTHYLTAYHTFSIL